MERLVFNFRFDTKIHTTKFKTTYFSKDCASVDWCQMAKEKIQWQFLVSTATKNSVP
jgi:hypothetical protein